MARGKLTPLPSLLYAQSQDNGDRSMRAAGRIRWNADDFNAASESLDAFVVACYGEGEEGRRRFLLARALEEHGFLHVGMSMAELEAALATPVVGPGLSLRLPVHREGVAHA